MSDVGSAITFMLMLITLQLTALAWLLTGIREHLRELRRSAERR